MSMNGKSVFALFPIVVLCVATAPVHAQTGASSPNGGAAGGPLSLTPAIPDAFPGGQVAAGSGAVARGCSSRRDLRLRCLRK